MMIMFGVSVIEMLILIVIVIPVLVGGFVFVTSRLRGFRLGHAHLNCPHCGAETPATTGMCRHCGKPFA